MTKQNTSSNGVPQGNAAHSTSENANNIINANLYAEIRYVNSKGKQISRIVNLDNRYGHSNLNRAFGALGRLNESSKTTIVIDFYYNSEKVGYVFSRKDEYEKGIINYCLHLNSEPDRDYHISRANGHINLCTWGIMNTMMNNRIHPSVKMWDEWRNNYVKQLKADRAEAAELIKNWDNFDKSKLDEMEREDIHKLIEDLSDTIFILDNEANMDSYKLRKLLYDILSHSFADYSNMIEWLGENGEMSIGVECEDYLVEDLTITVRFCGSLGDVLDDVSFYAENVEPLSYMSIDIIDAIKESLGVYNETDNEVA